MVIFHRINGFKEIVFLEFSMEAYLEIVRKILQKGVRAKNRTGVDTIAIFGEKFEHDMADGFPLVTTKKLLYPQVLSELEFFIKGLTDKRWLQERNNHIWDAWSGRISYIHDDEKKGRCWKNLIYTNLRISMAAFRRGV